MLTLRFGFGSFLSRLSYHYRKAGQIELLKLQQYTPYQTVQEEDTQ